MLLNNNVNKNVIIMSQNQCYSVFQQGSSRPGFYATFALFVNIELTNKHIFYSPTQKSMSYRLKMMVQNGNIIQRVDVFQKC